MRALEPVLAWHTTACALVSVVWAARFFERARGVVRLASLFVGFVSLFVQALDQRSLRLELLFLGRQLPKP